MRKKTKPYTTLMDRTWKDKEWFTSYKSQKNIRKLTDEEAKPLLEEGSIKEVLLPKYEEDVVGTNHGTMFCRKCGSEKGFFVKKYPFGHKLVIYTCAECGCKEKHNLK